MTQNLITLEKGMMRKADAVFYPTTELIASLVINLHSVEWSLGKSVVALLIQSCGAVFPAVAAFLEKDKMGCSRV